MARRRGRRGRGRGRRRRKSEPIPTWAIFAGIGLLLALFGYLYFTSPPTIAYDPETFCPEDAANIPHVEVLLFERNRRVRIDTGEFVPISPNTSIEIRRQLERNLDSIPKHSAVEIYEVSYLREKQFDPLKRFCNPGDGSDLSELRGNPRLARQRYIENFREPFKEMLASLSSWSPDNRFSLVDSLGGISRLVLGNPEYDRATKSLTVISDFIVPQNFLIGGRIPNSFGDVPRSAALSDFDDFVEAGGMRFDFRGSSVRMIVNRAQYVNIPDIQGTAHIAWWERFFDGQNATLEGVDRVGEW